MYAHRGLDIFNFDISEDLEQSKTQQPEDEIGCSDRLRTESTYSEQTRNASAGDCGRGGGEAGDRS